MPLFFHGCQPVKINFDGHSARRVYYNGKLIWQPCPPPVFSYTGQTFYDPGARDGIWKLFFLTDGLLTLHEPLPLCSLLLQGGGGSGGAGSADQRGSDGQDGALNERLRLPLEAGEYAVKLGSGGMKNPNGPGLPGGETRFGSLLLARGGAGGAYLQDHQAPHAGLYQDYGLGGRGGTSDDFSGGSSTAYWATPRLESGYIYIRTQPRWNAPNQGTLSAGSSLRLENTALYPDTDSGKSYEWYKLAEGRGYVRKDQTEVTEKIVEERQWFGLPGKPGIVLLRGEA